MVVVVLVVVVVCSVCVGCVCAFLEARVFMFFMHACLLPQPKILEESREDDECKDCSKYASEHPRQHADQAQPPWPQPHAHPPEAPDLLVKTVVRVWAGPR